MPLQSIPLRSRFARTALALAAGLAFGTALAADPPVAAGAAPAATPAASTHTPLLWKVSDADNSLYLLGSIHVLKPGDYPLSADIDAALDDAEHVMFEVDLQSMAAPENLAKMQQVMMAGDGQPLSARLSPEARTQLETLLKAGGASLAQVEALDPWAMNLSMALGIMQAMGFQADAGVDKHIDTRDRAAGKSLGALETLGDQFDTLDAAPMSEQLQGLEEFLADPKRTASELDLLHRAWLSGDIDTLDKTLRAEFAAESPETYRLINVARNDRWIPLLEARLKDHASDDTLAVVGALHLLGADGVVEKLRARGYRVERVCSACGGPPAAAKD